MEKEFEKEYGCPVCKANRSGFFDQISRELQIRGVVRKGWSMALESKHGAVLDEARLAVLPIGTELPAFAFQTDICIECGSVYVRKLRRFTIRWGIDIKKEGKLPAFPPLIVPEFRMGN